MAKYGEIVNNSIGIQGHMYVTRLIRREGHSQPYSWSPSFQWVAYLLVLSSRGQCKSGGCGRPSQCSYQSHLASVTSVPSGESCCLGN